MDKESIVLDHLKPLYISLGEDCSISYHLNLHGLREFAYPFDYALFKDVIKLISFIDDIFQDNISSFFDKSNWIFKELKKPTHLIENKITWSKYKAINKIYKCEYPHEFTDQLDWKNFVEKYSRRIDRLKQITKSDRSIIFIRGTNILNNKLIDNNIDTIKEYEKNNKLLEDCLKKHFSNYKNIIYINFNNYLWIDGIDSWTRSNINLLDFL